MANHTFGFPYNARYRFRLEDKQYRVSGDGLAVLALLQEIYEASRQASAGTWALRVRKQIRQIETLNMRAVLVLVIARSPDPHMRLLAIWLRGRCGGYVGTSIIAAQARQGDLMLQKECVRALQRLSAWAELREISQLSTHARVRAMAVQQPAKPYRERLTRMLSNVEPVSAPRSKPYFWQLPGLKLNYARPKSVETIRLILARIRRLVSGAKA